MCPCASYCKSCPLFGERGTPTILLSCCSGLSRCRVFWQPGVCSCSRTSLTPSLSCALFCRYYFEEQWKKYLAKRGILDGVSLPTFPSKYGVEERDSFYTSLSYDGWAGSSGHDAPMIAYDALLGAGDSWTELAHRAFFHAGDSDSTAAIAACWWGAMHGFRGVAASLYAPLEYRERLEKVGKDLYRLT